MYRVDLAAVGVEPQDTAEHLDDLTHTLFSKWHVTIRHNSRQLLNTALAFTTTQHNELWEQTAYMDLLGHRLSSNASVEHCWNQTHAKLWGAFPCKPWASQVATPSKPQDSCPIGPFLSAYPSSLLLAVACPD